MRRREWGGVRRRKGGRGEEKRGGRGEEEGRSVVRETTKKGGGRGTVKAC